MASDDLFGSISSPIDFSNLMNEFFTISPALDNQQHISTDMNSPEVIPNDGNQYHAQVEGPPAIYNIENNFKFEARVEPPGTKDEYLVSDPNIVFLKMNKPLPIKFEYENIGDDKFIRATPVFDSPGFHGKYPIRCLNHQNPKHKVNENFSADYLHHILRIDYYQSGGEKYIGNKNNNKVWPSVVFQIKKNNEKSCIYKFCCRNSCQIEKDNIKIIFTLEDSKGNIHGCASISVRVSAIPKRSRDKYLENLKKEPHKANLGVEDNSSNNSIISKQVLGVTSKKRKIAHHSNIGSEAKQQCSKIKIKKTKQSIEKYGEINPITIPTFGTELAKRILQYSFDIMAGHMTINHSNADAQELSVKCMETISLEYERVVGSPIMK